ncbi:hypothetical protein [Phenylobacterium sp.]|uniref:hypothetical protein n=1 Tax=Phenylobacterium sp. TaxID=1871053 RepID=UPI0035B2297A
MQRYAVRPDSSGYTVMDLDKGGPATLGGMTQSGLSKADAEHTAAVLNGDTPVPEPQLVLPRR